MLELMQLQKRFQPILVSLIAVALQHMALKLPYGTSHTVQTLQDPPL